MPMRSLAMLLVVSALACLDGDRPASAGSDPLADAIGKIRSEVIERGKAYDDLRELTAQGHRLSGSAGAARGVEWARKKLASYGFDRVELQPVTVPSWTRGDIERAMAAAPSGPVKLEVAALGNSVGTPRDGIEAAVVEVKGIDEVKKLGGALKGKIVFFNRPMDPDRKNTFKAYGGAVDQRVAGASAAAREGAVAVLVRSMTTLPDEHFPHTGIVIYEKDAPKIPAAALSTHSAGELSALLGSNPGLKVTLKLSAAQQPPARSFNVIGEWTGRELPKEYVVVGGHLDSWDLGTGAHDDGAGVVHAIEAARVLKALGLRPRRTVRVVLFMSEEFDGAGAEEYARQARLKKEKHYAAIESDSGGFAPVGFSVEGNDQTIAKLKKWGTYLAPLHADSLEKGYSGADVGKLTEQGALCLGFVPDSTHYFDFHHSARDRIEAVHRDDLHRGAAAMAVLTYLLAEKGL
jgi:hypothetical protein